jgi:antitoxin VapB
MSETTVFQSGNSQAVRLPKEFRFASKTVEIFRRGDEIVLREKRRTLAESLVELPPLVAGEAAAFNAAMQQARERRAPEERDWQALWNPGAAAPRKRRASKK